MHNRPSHSYGARDLEGKMQPMFFNVDKYEITRIVTDEQWKENCYLVQCRTSGNMLLVDPGSNFDEIERIARTKSGDLKHVFLTHAHHDHVAAAKEVFDSWGSIIFLNKMDAKLLQRAPLYAMRFAGKTIRIPDLDTIVFFDETKQFSFADSSIEAIHTPGHTHGSTCYSFGSFIFTGDTLLYEKIGRTDLPEGDKQKIRESVALLLRKSDAKTIFFPGHGRPFFGEEAKMWWRKYQGNPPQDNAFES